MSSRKFFGGYDSDEDVKVDLEKIKAEASRNCVIEKHNFISDHGRTIDSKRKGMFMSDVNALAIKASENELFSKTMTTIMLKLFDIDDVSNLQEILNFIDELV